MTRERLHEILEGHDPKYGRYSILLQQSVLLLALLLFSLSTLPGSRPIWLQVSNFIVLICFAIEYGLRLWAAPKRMAYAFSFWGIVDLMAFLPMLLFHAFDSRAIRALRLLQILRILKFARYNKAINRMYAAMIAIRAELMVALVMASIVLFLASVGIWVFEREAQPDDFGSVFHCLWWAVATLTTVGYGDVYPVTMGGRIFTGVILVIGLAVVAIPTGLVSAALTRQDERDDPS